MKLLAKLLILLFLVSCVASKQKAKRDPISIYDIKWHVESLNGELVELPDNSKDVFVMFKTDKPGQLAGNNGCNSFFGGYEISGDTLKLSEVIQTMMACQDPFAEIETRFMEALNEVKRYSAAGDKLYFLTKSDTVAVFRKE